MLGSMDVEEMGWLNDTIRGRRLWIEKLRRTDNYTPKSRIHDTEISSDEFHHPLESVSLAPSSKGRPKLQAPEASFAEQFTSPPLLPGLLTSLKEMIGNDARPTPIQSLSLKWLLAHPGAQSPSIDTAPRRWRQFLLASETGSGKSIAYLLPLLQNLKEAELVSKDASSSSQPSSQRPYNPRGIILAPTHELSRQLSGFAKSLLHEIKLRVLCTSQANQKSTSRRDSTSSKMSSKFSDTSGGPLGEFQVARSSHPVDILVGTPMKVLEMVHGRGWDRKEMEDDGDEEIQAGEEKEEATKKPRRGRDKMVGVGKWRSKPELGLANVEWVVVDEADVLFDPDFQETTRMLLADISSARGHLMPVLPSTELSTVNPQPLTPVTSEPIDYPFNLLLTSATIPNSLNLYLEKHHPSLIRLASPRLHHLPKTLQTEYVNWTGGNKLADVERRIRRVWAEDAANTTVSSLSKILVFCNKSTKVIETSKYLSEKGIKNVPMTSQSEHRGRGSNKHLAGFLRKDDNQVTQPSTNVTDSPHVMITTSLLSRGLDFSPSIKHVFIVDEPRNMIDFLHRAGRSGRAGEKGKVVVFGKMTGRGSSKAKDVRKRVGALVL
ncbi:P-loop containing nucleoside triphosphate hydrolase protein [Phlegmacium glaucopus]|nr:P-loop containing nucleoside triphosphate hydrolase protein [Phlegmacium glaucopus]